MQTISSILNELYRVFDTNQIITEDHRQQAYYIDWRERYFTQSCATVFPSSVDQLSKFVKLCVDLDIAIIPQGGNTSTCGGSVPSMLEKRPQIILNLSKLKETLCINKENASITVSAGYTLSEVQRVALDNGFYFPLSIASEGTAQIGGLCATNAGGIHVIKYGNMRDLVLGIEAVTPNGEIINQLNMLRKNNTNFDLKQLFIGSEGTLGVITKAVLKLFPKPNNYLTLLLGVDDIQKAIDLLYVLQTNCDVCAFELIGKSAQDMHNQYFKQIPVSANWLILVELEVNSLPEHFDDYSMYVYSLLEKLHIDENTILIATDESNRKQFWQYREQIPLAEKSYGKAVKHDIALPINYISEFIAVSDKYLTEKYPDCNIIVFGHLGDGNLHYNVVLPHIDTDQFEMHENTVNEIVYKLVYEYGGTFSAEHGIGQLKCDWFKRFYDKSSYSLGLNFKRMIDPKNIFNPYKIW